MKSLFFWRVDEVPLGKRAILADPDASAKTSLWSGVPRPRPLYGLTQKTAGAGVLTHTVQSQQNSRGSVGGGMFFQVN